MDVGEDKEDRSSTARIKKYKNKGLSVEEGRKKREEEGFQLRKSKRDEQLSKRRNISEEAIDEKYFPKGTSIDVLHKSLYSLVEEEQLAALTRFRKLLSSSTSPPIEEVFSCGCMPKIVEFLTASTLPSRAMLQFEASWIITNLASGSSIHTKAVVDAGAVPLLVKLLLAANFVRDQAVWALGNISGDGQEMRDIVLSYGVMKPLLNILDSEHERLIMASATWTLSHLCKGRSAVDEVMQALPTLAKLLHHDDKAVVSDSLWCVAHLADGPNNKIQRVIEGGFCRRLPHLLLQSTEKDIVIPALRAVGNILTGDDVQTQIMINCSVLPALQGLLTSSYNNIVKNACWAISNITAGNRVQIQAVIDCNIIPQLLEVVTNEAEYKTRKEAAWAVLNATSGGTEAQIRYIVSVGSIQPLCSMLTVQDARMVGVTLEGLDNILKVGKKNALDGVNPYAAEVEEAYGLDRIEHLQMCPSEENSKLATRIIERYFS